MSLDEQQAARLLLLGGQGLLDDPDRSASSARVQKIIEQLGFVQVDSIIAIARAHDLTLFARLHRYRPEMLRVLIEEKRTLFEAWTHDASIIPTRWYSQWKPRHARALLRLNKNGWWRSRFGTSPEKTLADVEARIKKDGAIFARDFEEKRLEVGWWGWTPSKAALELLWRAGRLAISKRINFQKVYDLAERVYPKEHEEEAPTLEAHNDWACRTALERLGFATAAELSRYWASIDLKAARTWVAEGLKRGELVAIDKKTVAFHDWKKRASKLSAAPDLLRMLAPFDPTLRDRARAERVFDYSFRLEVFVPQPKRQYGYYVLPILDGERFIGRIEPKLEREQNAIVVRGLWWEPKVKVTKKLRSRLDDALERLAEFTGAKDIILRG